MNDKNVADIQHFCAATENPIDQKRLFGIKHLAARQDFRDFDTACYWIFQLLLSRNQ